LVIWTSGANLRAMAQRGSRFPTVPSSVQLDGVHLHHDAVGAVIERGEELLELRDLRVGLFEVRGEGVVPLDRKAPSHERFQQLVLCRDGELLAGRLDVEAEDSQAALWVILGSSWRSDPAAALRGLANVGSPACSRSR